MCTINVNGCSVCLHEIKIVKHRFNANNGSGNWYATIVYQGVVYDAEIERNVMYDGYVYYMGYLKNEYIRKKYSNTYLVFGNSDICDCYRYILEAMVRVIKGDYSEIMGVGFCVARPDNC